MIKICNEIIDKPASGTDEIVNRGVWVQSLGKCNNFLVRFYSLSYRWVKSLLWRCSDRAFLYLRVSGAITGSIQYKTRRILLIVSAVFFTFIAQKQWHSCKNCIILFLTHIINNFRLKPTYLFMLLSCWLCDSHNSTSNTNFSLLSFLRKFKAWNHYGRRASMRVCLCCSLRINWRIFMKPCMCSTAMKLSPSSYLLSCYH